MALDYDGWHQVAKDLKTQRRTKEGEKLSSYPSLDTEALLSSGDLARKNLARGYTAAIDLPRRLKEKRAEIEGDKDYSSQGRAKQLEAFSKSVVDPGISSLRGELLPLMRAEAADRMSAAKGKMPQPESPFEVAVAQEVWRIAREEKLGPMEVREASEEVQAAVALAPPEVVGMNPRSHALVRSEYTEQFGGPDLVEAENFSKAVQTLSDAIDYAQVDIDLDRGREPAHPLKVKRPKPEDIKKAEAVVKGAT